MSNSIFKSGERIEARVQIPGAEVADYAWMPEPRPVGALSQRGSVYFGAFANFEVNTRTISTTNFDANPQR
jgi:hypothetical protein